MGVSIYYFYHGFGLKAFEGRHIRITHIYNHDIEKRQVSLMYFCTAKNMEEITSQLNNNKSIFTGNPIKFNLFISNNIIIRITVKLLPCNK